MAIRCSRPDPNEWSQLNNLLGSVELTVNSPPDGSITSPASTMSIAITDLNVTGDPHRVVRLCRFYTKSTTSIAPDLNIRATTPNEAGRTPLLDIASKTKTALWDLRGAQTHGQRLESGCLRCSNRFTLGRLSRDCRRPLCAQQRVWQHRRAASRADLPSACAVATFFPERACVSPMPPDSRSRGLKKHLLDRPSPLPNPDLKPERTRSIEAGIQQSLFGGKFALTRPTSTIFFTIALITLSRSRRPSSDNM